MILGTAIYVFFILANNPGPQHQATSTTTAVNITLDDQPPQLFEHIPDVTRDDIEYNQLGFSQTGLDNTNHTLVISVSGLTEQIWVNFDYAIYTQVPYVFLVVEKIG